jgi:hypothetical protein
MSSHIMAVKIEKFSAENRVLIYRKVADLKGMYPRQTIKHVLGPTHGNNPDILQQAEVGKSAIVFSYWYGGAYDGFGGPEAAGGLVRSYTYIDKRLYICYVGNWDGGRCDDQRTVAQRFCCSPARLRAAVTDVLAGKEAVISCLVKDGQGHPTVQRLRVSQRLLDYNAKRDFVSQGGEDDYFLPLHGMPGFSHFTSIGRIGWEAQAISVTDFDGDGKPDLCLIGANRISLVQNAGDAMLEFPVPGVSGGGRAAVWADYNGDGKPDLLLATPAGPKLLTNLGGGNFRDDTALLPKEAHYNLTAAAWLDYDGDGKPDILLGNGFHGLRLYRNKGKADAPPPQPGKAPTPPTWFEDVSAAVGLGPDGIGSTVKGDTLTVADVNGDGRPDILYGVGTGMLLVNTPEGFKEVKDSGISYKPGKVGPIFSDFDHSGHMSLFVPQLDGRCKLFKNDGTGRFTDVTAQAGDLAKPIGMATSAAWGDIDNDGHLDLIVGCLKAPNRFYRNKGDGTFVDATEEVGLHRHIFNTQAVSIVDLNHDGVLDVVLNNEGQDSVVLLGDATRPRKRTPLTLSLTGNSGIVGSRVRVVDANGKAVAVHHVGAGEGRGGQAPAQAHFALHPGGYRLEVRFSSGLIRNRDITVELAPLHGLLADK